MNTGIAIFALGVLVGCCACKKSSSDALAPTPADAPYLPDAQVGLFYQQSVDPTPGAAAYETVSGSPPPGLALDALSGVLTGTPTLDGEFSFTVRRSAGGSGAATALPWRIRVRAP